MRVPLHVVRERRQRLALLLQQHAYLPVQEVCRRLNISEATARRDLVFLAGEKRIIRTFGGALSDFNQRFAPFQQRLKVAAEAKRAIAQAAFERVREGITIFLDAGTTIFALAEELARRPIRPLKVVTNSLPAAERLASIDGIDVFLPGGQWLQQQSILMGESARRAVAFYDIDLAFIGAEGFDASGIWNTQRDVVLFQRAVLKKAKQNAFCLDASKFRHRASEKLVKWDRVGLLISDLSASEFAANGISLPKRAIVSVFPSKPILNPT